MHSLSPGAHITSTVPYRPGAHVGSGARAEADYEGSEDQIAKEIGRSLVLNEDAERTPLSFCGPLLRDIIILLHRNEAKERTVSDAYRSGLEQSGGSCSREQDSDGT